MGGSTVQILANAVRWAADHGASAINISAGFDANVGDGLADGSINILKEAIDYAYARGLTIVATAGNSGNEQIRYPGAFGEVPGLPGIQDERLVLGVIGSWCSLCPVGKDNEGRDPGSNYGLWYDFSAPFEEDSPVPLSIGILSTIPTETGSCTFPHEQNYARDSGTSFAAPQVAGLAMLLTTMGFSNNEVWNWIKEGVRDLPCDPGVSCPPGNDKFTGYGRIDANRSMELAYNERRATGPEMVVVPNAGRRAEQWYNFMAGGFTPGATLDVCYKMPGSTQARCLIPQTANEFGLYGISLQPTHTSPPGRWYLYMCQEGVGGACTSERPWDVTE